MIDIAQNFQEAVDASDYVRSSNILSATLREKKLPELIAGLREIEEGATLITLELRDHILRYLAMWDIYFAVQISSIDILRLLEQHNVQDEPQIFMVDFIRRLFENRDALFDPFCVNIRTISKGHYAILVQPIIEQRTEELLKCKIPYIVGPPKRYCAADLLDTYYGSKTVTATLGYGSFDIVINEEQYQTIRDSLDSVGFDISTMLQEFDPDEWEKYVNKRRRPKDLHTGSSIAQHPGREFSELIVLHRVKSARSNIYSDVFQRQDAALRAIERAKTQRCNDTLMDVASNPTHPMRMRALHELGELGDSTVLSFLDNIMKKDRDKSIRREAARAYSRLSSKYAGLDLSIPIPASKPPALNIAEINRTLNNLLDKGMPTTMIDETINSVVLQGGADSVNVLLRLFSKPNMSVKAAIVKATKLLDKESAAVIIRTALEDESETIRELAEEEINSRWPDDVWK